MLPFKIPEPGSNIFVEAPLSTDLVVLSVSNFLQTFCGKLQIWEGVGVPFSAS
jgi:hypothetical protein